MEIAIVKAEKDSEKAEDSSQIMSKNKELADGNSLPERIVRKVNHKDLLALNGNQSRSGEICIQEPFLQHIRGLKSKIPKHIISLDEKYLWHCLKLIYVSASKGVSSNIPTNLSSSNMGVLSQSLSSLKITSTFACDLANLVAKCPLEAGSGNVVISNSIMNILKSPLFHQSGVMERDISFATTDLIDITKSVGSDFMASDGGLSISSSQKLEKKIAVLGNNSYGSEFLPKRLGSVSSTNSTVSDHSFSSVPAGFTRGMLQCTWKGGFPRYVLSLDDHKEVYVANLCMTNSPGNKVLDYMYMFHSGAGGKKEHEVCVKESNLVGKMKISTMFSLCLNNSQTMETEFVLFGADGSSSGEMQTSSHNLKKKKGLSKKVVEVFKSSHSSRERTSFKYQGTSVILENSSWSPCLDMYSNPISSNPSMFSENSPPPNLELAAIIVKEHICGSHQGTEMGGWGLKFLKTVETKQKIASVEASPSGCCERNIGDCSTSMDILVPAGFHGGSRNKNGGPSSLTERWRSGGLCDCGGWDIGCPITVLNTRPSLKEVSPAADARGGKSFELFIQGSTQGAQVMNMVDTHDGSYLIHFRSTLSALQSFSIAVAIIHSRTPALQPKVYRS